MVAQDGVFERRRQPIMHVGCGLTDAPKPWCPELAVPGVTFGHATVVRRLDVMQQKIAVERNGDTRRAFQLRNMAACTADVFKELLTLCVCGARGGGG